MDFYDSLDHDERIARESVRSAVVLAKIRYDEQLAPFVRESRARLESTLVRTELDRIIKECASEVGANEDVVAKRFLTMLSDVVLPVTQPETVNVTDLGAGPSEPSVKNTEEKPEPQATTDVKDHGVVLQDEIENPGKIIDLYKMSCFRCETNDHEENSPLCADCEASILLEAGVTPDFLAGKTADMAGTPAGGYSQNSTAPVPGGQQGVVGPQQPMTPLNPNSPYQCNVCGYTGNFHDVQTHIMQASDPQHMQAKQNGTVNPSGGPQQQQMASVGGLTWTKQADEEDGSGSAYEDNIHKDEVKVDPAQQQANPKTHFEQIIQTMANRAAARSLSTPSEKTIQSVAQAYGLDPEQVKSSLFITATFGDYSFTNGQAGQQQPPQGYVPLNLDGKQGQDSGHEVVVPVIPAVRKTADDLGMDENSVYSSVKDNMGADLSDDYHVTAQGQYTLYVPSALMDQATNHPQPAPPADQSAAPQGPPPGGPGGAPPGGAGSPIESMQPIQQMQPSSGFHGEELDPLYLDWLMAKDEEVASQRMARRGYIKLRT